MTQWRKARKYVKFRLKLRYAWRGLLYVSRTQNSFRLFRGFAVLAVFAAIVLKFSVLEFVVIGLSFVFVLSLETLNTAIERICDFVHGKHHQTIGLIKDVAAGAVLISAMASAAAFVAIMLTKLAA